MSILKILTPDEQEFYDSLIKNHVPFFKDFIALNDYKINFVGMFSDSREFVVAFNEENSGNDDLSDTIISFKVRHNHGNYKINHVSIHNVHKINLNVNTFFMVEPVFDHVV